MFSVIENSVNLDAVKFDAFYRVKLIFGKYFRYFDANRAAGLLQLDAIRVPVRERVKDKWQASWSSLTDNFKKKHSSFY